MPLTTPQLRLLTAICDRLIPPGPEGPSATEAGVVTFIERQLDGPWGHGARMYREGPFVQPDAGHGWQSPLTPAEVYAHGLDAIARHVRERHDGELADLDPAAQDEIVTAWEAGELTTFSEVDGRAFFAMVRQNAVEGLLSDPGYGGNRDMVGWRWLGYPGVARAHGDDYRDHIGRHGEPYSAEPVALEPRPRR